jgi:hypothetical protein
MPRSPPLVRSCSRPERQRRQCGRVVKIIHACRCRCEAFYGFADGRLAGRRRSRGHGCRIGLRRPTGHLRPQGDGGDPLPAVQLVASCGTSSRLRGYFAVQAAPLLLRPMWASRGVHTPLCGRWASRLRRCSSLPRVRGGQLQRHRAHAHEVLNMLYLVGAAAALPGDRRQQLHDEVDAGHVNGYRYSL